jgi:hypothetical protein
VCRLCRLSSSERVAARANREGKLWAISVKGLPGALSRVRRLDQTEAMAREVIALVLDVPEDSFDVVVAPGAP